MLVEVSEKIKIGRKLASDSSSGCSGAQRVQRIIVPAAIVMMTAMNDSELYKTGLDY